MKELIFNLSAPVLAVPRDAISVGSKVFCRSCEASGVVEKINGKSLLIKRDDRYITRYRRGDGSVYMECDKWVGRADNWAVMDTIGEDK